MYDRRTIAWHVSDVLTVASLQFLASSYLGCCSEAGPLKKQKILGQYPHAHLIQYSTFLSSCPNQILGLSFFFI